MKVLNENKSLLASYYRLSAENRRSDTSGDYLDGVIVLHKELELRGVAHKWPI